MDLLMRIGIGSIPSIYVLCMIYYAANRKSIVGSYEYSSYNVVILWLPKLIHSYHIIYATYSEYDEDSDIAYHLGIKIDDGYVYKSKSTILYCHIVEYPIYLIWFWFHILQIKIRQNMAEKAKSMDEFNHLYKNAKDKVDKSNDYIHK